MKIRKTASALILAGCLIAALPACKSKIDDATVKTNVESVLTAVPDIAVEVKDGIVTLSGAVTDEAAKTQAESVVNALKADAKSGVKSVVNNITVVPPVAPPVEISPDAILQQSVAAVIKDFPDVTATVANGIITVTGSLDKARVQTLKQVLDALKPQKTDMSQLKVK